MERITCATREEQNYHAGGGRNRYFTECESRTKLNLPGGGGTTIGGETTSIGGDYNHQGEVTIVCVWGGVTTIKSKMEIPSSSLGLLKSSRAGQRTLNETLK